MISFAGRRNTGVHNQTYRFARPRKPAWKRSQHHARPDIRIFPRQAIVSRRGGNIYLNFFSGLLYDPPAPAEAMARCVVWCQLLWVSVVGKRRPSTVVHGIFAVAEGERAMCPLEREQTLRLRAQAMRKIVVDSLVSVHRGGASRPSNSCNSWGVDDRLESGLVAKGDGGFFRTRPSHGEPPHFRSPILLGESRRAPNNLTHLLLAREFTSDSASLAPETAVGAADKGQSSRGDLGPAHRHRAFQQPCPAE